MTELLQEIEYIWRKKNKNNLWEGLLGSLREMGYY